jgi:DNA replication protein DnaC
MVAGNGMRPCPDCAERKRRARLLSLPEFSRYHAARLETLQARADKHWKQPALVEQIKREPEASYALFGLNQIGKTHLGWCVYAHAVEQGRPAIACAAATLLEKLTDLEFNDEARPPITAATLLASTQRWCVFLDDLTALPRFSIFAVHQFYQIFNAILQKRHQLIVTAHATQAAIEEAFNAGGFNMGASIIGRIKNADRMIIASGLMQTTK